ncbi:MAG: sulfate/molybdate ABC transporter ATP-binding protein [Lachnospiraceae bacterium]
MSVLVNIEKRLGSFFLKADFEAAEETLAILGASGCGKSMTLKCIAGIEKPDRGRIIVDGITLFDSEKKINLSPQQRQLGLMFQNYALFPNMTVKQNIRTGVKREGNKQGREKAVEEMMDKFGLTKLANHYPHQLSGGQQQRTALARILISSPRALLLDEPFSALDSHLRFRLEQEVREVIRQFKKSVLLVSHDRDEVFRMADSIAVMGAGQIEVFGAKAAVFAEPKTKTGARLTGCKNVSSIEKRGEHLAYAKDWGLELKLEKPLKTATAIGIRMHDIVWGEGENGFICRVTEEIENPFSYIIMLQLADNPGSIPFGWELDKETWKRIKAERVKIHIPSSAILLLEEGNSPGEEKE